MTEFQIGEQAVLGLMPLTGVRRLLGAAIPDPADLAAFDTLLALKLSSR